MNTILKFAVLSFVLIAVSSPRSGAQSADEIFHKFQKRYHTCGRLTLPYHLFVPDKYDSTLRYPLVLYLHGSGERGDNNEAVIRNDMAIVWALDSNQMQWPCIIVVPQCPLNHRWVNILWTRLAYSVDEIRVSDELLTVSDILDSLNREFSVDTNRVYITGLSMGGAGTWDMITRYPDRFAAAIPLCGIGDTAKVDVMKHIPIWVFHGKIDASVHVECSRYMMAALERAGRSIVYTNCRDNDCTGMTDSDVASAINSGAKLLYSEYPDVGHSVWEKVYENPFLLPWVFSQNRSQIASGAADRQRTSTPGGFTLFQNCPNPFNPATTISYSIPESCLVVVTIYDLLGREVRTLVDKFQPAGEHSVEFDAKGISSGIYFYELRCGESIRLRKMMVLKG